MANYSLQSGTPVSLLNFIDPEAGCDWSGVCGQVFDKNGAPLDGLLIEIGGTLEGKNINYYVLTGSSTQLGPGGFDVKLADKPVASNGSVYLQLLGIAGEPLTGQIPFETSSSCDQNLVLINLVEFDTDHDVFLPIITNHDGDRPVVP